MEQNCTVGLSYRVLYFLVNKEEEEQEEEEETEEELTVVCVSPEHETLEVILQSRRRRREDGGWRMKRRKSQLQYSLPHQCSRVVFVGQEKFFSPVNEECSSDDASDSIEYDMGSKHKSWEGLVWYP